MGDMRARKISVYVLEALGAAILLGVIVVMMRARVRGGRPPRANEWQRIDEPDAISAH